MTVAWYAAAFSRDMCFEMIMSEYDRRMHAMIRVM